MINRTEALIVTAALALATLPRFEARVEQFTSQHRTEIQMAVNQLEGKPVIPFAAPDASATQPSATVQLAMDREQQAPDLGALARSHEALRRNLQAAREQRQAATITERVRSEVAGLRVNVPAIPQMQLARLEPQLQSELAGLRILVERNPHGFKTYRLKSKRCPDAPPAPAVPVAEIPSASSVF